MATPTQELYSSLEFAYNHFNHYLFGGKLSPVVFTARELTKRKGIALGYYSKSRWINDGGDRRDEIAINFRGIGNVSIIAFLQTLVHEMCHKFQEEFGTPSRRTYHNLEFAAVMEQVGLVTTDTGQPGGARSGQYVTQYPLPGGPFVYACMKLMFEKEFKIAWLDVRQVNRNFNQLPDINELLTSPVDFEPVEKRLDGCLKAVNPSVFVLGKENEGAIGSLSIDDIDDHKLKFLEGLTESEEMASAIERIYQCPTGGGSWVDVESDDEDEEDRRKQASDKEKKTKACYICPSCSSKVWGKQGLLIKCLTGGCDKLMETVG